MKGLRKADVFFRHNNLRQGQAVPLQIFSLKVCKIWNIKQNLCNTFWLFFAILIANFALKDQQRCLPSKK